MGEKDEQGITVPPSSQHLPFAFACVLIELTGRAGLAEDCFVRGSGLSQSVGADSIFMGGDVPSVASVYPQELAVGLPLLLLTFLYSLYSLYRTSLYLYWVYKPWYHSISGDREIGGCKVTPQRYHVPTLHEYPFFGKSLCRYYCIKDLALVRLFQIIKVAPKCD